MINIKKQFGFTLVELAVVIAVVAALVVGSATLFKEQKVNVDREVTQDELASVKVALLRFIEENHYLPCPDTSQEGTSGFGTENRFNTSATFPGPPPTTVIVDVCDENSGTVPFETLGLPLIGVKDSQGNLFHYAVTQGVTDANSIANCPQNSACFFNYNTAPAFDITTRPVSGDLGANNLELCAGTDCSGQNLLSKSIVVIVVAYNHRATASNIGSEEDENRDGDATFIQAEYMGTEGESPFDDLLITISGHELKRGDRETYLRTNVSVFVPPPPPSAPDVFNLGAGSSGTNIGTDPATWDRVNKEIDFGVEAANKEVVLTYNTYTVGSWDQPASSHSNVTSDTGTVSSNGLLKKEYKYDYTDNTQDGVVAVSFVAGFTGNLDSRDQYGDAVTLSITEGEVVNTYVDYWNDSAEIILTTDAYGKVDLEFAVGTTATTETIDFTDIELVYYDTPPPVPELPTVYPISGIPQTEGL